MSALPSGLLPGGGVITNLAKLEQPLLEVIQLSYYGFLPTELLPHIGNAMVAHTFMDDKLKSAIGIIASINSNILVSFLAEMHSTSSRAEVFKNIARTTEPNLRKMAKMIVLANLAKKHSEDRNVIAHTVPYWVNEGKAEAGYFKDKVLTRPQIQQAAPYVANVEGLSKLAENMYCVGIWLGMLNKNVLPDDIMLDELSSEEMDVLLANRLECHPDWNDDSKFPWQEEFRSVLKSERNKPINSHRLSE